MLRWDTQNTICAIASGNKPGHRGIIRVSGPDSMGLLDSLLPESFPDQVRDSIRNRRGAIRCSACFELGAPFGSIPCDYWIWPTERSYTGQPSFELHMMGSLPILEASVNLLCRQGAHLAEPGEFTFRAFLANRLDLAQCEAVLGVIDAKSSQGLDVALQQLAGGLKIPVHELRQQLIYLLADLEAGLDFVDEDIEFIKKSDLIERLAQAIESIRPMLHQISGRSWSEHLPVVALFGVPNAGKSSLINAVVGHSASIVSEEPGTTRDFIRVRSSKLPIQWVDTAGVESTEEDPSGSQPRSQAQDQTRRQWSQAALRWLCIDLSHASLTPVQQIVMIEEGLRESAFREHVWVIGTKRDRAHPESLRIWSELQRERSDWIWIETSSVSRVGLDKIPGELEQWLVELDSEVTGILPSTLLRCRNAITDGLESLEHALASAQQGFGDELIASEIRIALDHLGVVSGEVYTDDILDALFSRFCIGK